MIADEIQAGWPAAGWLRLSTTTGAVPDMYLLKAGFGRRHWRNWSAVVADRGSSGCSTPASSSTFGGNPPGPRSGTTVVEILATGEFQSRPNLGEHLHARLRPDRARRPRRRGFDCGPVSTSTRRWAPESSCLALASPFAA